MSTVRVSSAAQQQSSKFNVQSGGDEPLDGPSEWPVTAVTSQIAASSLNRRELAQFFITIAYERKRELSYL